jgi:hypothetical protein
MLLKLSRKVVNNILGMSLLGLKITQKCPYFSADFPLSAVSVSVARHPIGHK